MLMTFQLARSMFNWGTPLPFYINLKGGSAVAD